MLRLLAIPLGLVTDAAIWWALFGGAGFVCGVAFAVWMFPKIGVPYVPWWLAAAMGGVWGFGFATGVLRWAVRTFDPRERR
jgi:hypothetical protein